MTQFARRNWPLLAVVLVVAAAGAVDAWLASPYGETGRMLTTCHDAPAFEYGVAATTQSGTRWLTVLVAAQKSATVSSGAC